MKKKIMFYCHYSLGIGHLVRTIALAKGVKKINPDSDVLIVSGGQSIQIKIPFGIRLVQLPPLRESQNSRELESLSDESADEVKKSRTIRVIRLFKSFKPDFLFIEHFPFGRRELGMEIINLLNAATHSSKRPAIISSMRDMAFVDNPLQEDSSSEIKYFLNKFFDYLLVHSDYKIIRIEEELKILKEIKIPIIYTGYVSSTSEDELKDNNIGNQDSDFDKEKKKGVLISAGGGRDCFDFVKKTIEAKDILDRKAKSRFLVLTGPFLSEDEFSLLKGLAKKKEDIILKRFEPDFINILSQADVSVSNSGYNTITELLLTKTKALLIPRIKNSQINREQLERAKKIKKLISAEILDPRELTPEKIALCLERLIYSKIHYHQDNKKESIADLKGADFVGEFIKGFNKSCTVFFRDDDVDELTDNFMDLAGLFSDKNLPIHYSVIPDMVAGETIDYLNELKKKQLRVEIGQHGRSHKNYGDSAKYEFGDNRSYREQYKDISAGREKIESYFGKNPNIVFTPPHNRFNSDTIKALGKLGFKIISGSLNPAQDKKTINSGNINNIPVCIDLFRKTDKGWLLKDKEELIKEFFIKRSSCRIIGIMLHHKFFSDTKEIQRLEGFIDFLIKEGVQFKSISEINAEINCTLDYSDEPKKTVAYLRSNFLPVSENFIYSEIKNLEKYKQIVISVARKNEDIFNEIEIIAQPRFVYLHTKDFPFIKNSQTYLYSQYIDYCADIIGSRNVSLLHAQFGDDALFFLPLKRKTKLPMVVSFRGYDLYRLPNKFKRLYDPLFKEADLFLTRSESMKKDLIKMGCPPEKVVVHHSSVDMEDIGSITNCAVGNETKIQVIFAGRFVEKKGILDVIKAFSRLKEECDNVELKLAGEGPLKKQIVKLVSELKIKDVTFLNFLQHEDLINEMKKSDIFVLPSKTASDGNKEGIPVVLMEAMACGLPVVSTLHSGIPELVADKKSGFLINEGDVDGIYDKLRYLIQNPELRRKMGLYGRNIVEEQFNIKKQTLLLEKNYEKLLQGKPQKELLAKLKKEGMFNEREVTYVLNLLNMLQTGKPSYFRADLHLIKGCNSHCIMCDNWKSNIETSFGSEEISRLLKDLKNFGVTYIRFHGQEPTLRNDLIQIVEEAKELGFKVGLKTNALLLGEDYIKKLCDAGLDTIYFSIDSSDEIIHNKHRGNNISFERNIDAIKYFRRYKKDIKILINSVITTINYQALDKIPDLAKDLKVDGVGFVHLNTKNKKDVLNLRLNKNQMIEFYSKVVPHILQKGNEYRIPIDINPMPWPIVNKPVDVQIKQLREFKENNKDNLEQYSSDFAEGKYGKKFFEKNICYGPLDHITIDSDGSVYPCCAMKRDKRLAIGNIHEKSFSELWNSECYKIYRDAIISGNCPFKDECARSHDSMAVLNKAAGYFPGSTFPGSTFPGSTFPGSTFLDSNKEPFEFKRLKTLYFMPQEHLGYIQLEKLKEIIKTAYNEVPLYKELFDKRGIKPEDINCLENIKKLPILTKEIIRENFPDRLIAKNMDKSKIRIEQSSGSVSESVQFAKLKQDNEFYWMAHAFYMTGEWKWPQKYAKFTTFNCSAGYCSYDRDKEFDENSLKITLPSSNNIFGDDESKFQERIGLLNKFKPSILHADPVYLRALAIFIKKKGIKLPFIKAISSTYELLTESNKRFLESVFNCKIFDQYGCSELGPVANSCEKGNKHIYMDKVIVEILKDNEDSKFGRIVVTDLNNHVMPLIRYDTGDIGHFIEERCSCGRNSGVLEIDGRVIDVIRIGREWFTPREIDRLFEGTPGIKLYRVIQKNENEFKIEIMGNKQFRKQYIDRIEKNFKNYLSKDINLKFESVGEMLPMNSGKYPIVKGIVKGVRSSGN